jgi:stage IV sporulation protein A
MEAFDIYNDISERTKGDIYIGVVGPVRTGKSTFIKKFMDLMVLPNLDDSHDKERVVDELPQSAAGKTIMTTQPKFVPNEAVELVLNNEAKMKIRMVDSVGYMVDGAMGHMEDGQPRMVRTPWYDYDIPFKQAADLGTQKVIEEHSTIGIIMTTDGSITEIARENYIEAETKAINELKKFSKPFVIVLNSMSPKSDSTIKLKQDLENKHGVPVEVFDIMRLTEDDIKDLLKSILYEFPIKEIIIDTPKWCSALDKEHWFLSDIVGSTQKSIIEVEKVSDYYALLEAFDDVAYINSVSTKSIYLGEGKIVLLMDVDETLFYKVIGEQCGYEIKDDYHLISIIKDLVKAKKGYDKIEAAMASVEQVGYGVVPPSMDELILDEPEIVKQGTKYGVKLKATAPSLHLIKVDIQTEVSPMVGTEQQSEDLVDYLIAEYDTDPTMIWSTNIFGKSLHELVKDGLSNKLTNMPEDARYKMQETLQRIINEGNGGMICILL